MNQTTAKQKRKRPRRVGRLTEKEKTLLNLFHKNVKACLDKDQKIRLLKEHAELKFGPPIAYRRDFIRIRAQFKIDKCLACGGKATDKHHVIGLNNGGRNHKHNVVGLCYDCHMGVHPEMKDKFESR